MSALKKFAIVVTGQIGCLILLPWAMFSQGYTGSQACAGCHAEISRKYFKTSMGNASGKVEPGAPKQPSPGSFVHTLSGTQYSLQTDARGMLLEFSKAQATGIRRLEYYIGSGSHARGYLYRYGEMLFQAPVAYYTNRQKWDMAPGYETEHSIFLGRKIEQTCLDCHASGRTEQTPFTEGAVSCERCHGPGSAHIAKFTPQNEKTPLGIFNPAKMPPRQRDSVCAQCHLTGEARVQKQNTGSFTAGETLTDRVVPFVRSSPDPDNLKVIGHFEGLWLSRCKRTSGDKMWCGTCHDPHQEPAAEQKAAYFRTKCFTCHTEASCTAKTSERKAQGDNCAACHMPKQQAVDGLHAAFTDHSIRRFGNKSAGTKSNVKELVPFWPGTGSQRDLALAYMDVASRTHQEADYLRAFAALQKALPEAGEDDEVLANLGYLYDLSGDPATAVQMYQRALRSNAQNTLALTNLGQHLATEGKASEAIALWQRVTATEPGLAAPSLNLAYAFLQTGDVTNARKALENLLYFNPDFEKGLALRKQIGR